MGGLKKCCTRCACGVCCLLALIPEMFVFAVCGYFYMNTEKAEKWDSESPIVPRKNSTMVMDEGCCQATCHPEARLGDKDTANIYPPGACQCTSGTKSMGSMCCITGEDVDWRLEPSASCLVPIHMHLNSCHVAATGLDECPQKVTLQHFNPLNVKNTLVLRSLLKASQLLKSRPTAVLSQKEGYISVATMPPIEVSQTMAFQEFNISVNLMDLSVWGMFGNNQLVKSLQNLKLNISMPEKSLDKAEANVSGEGGEPVEVPMGGHVRGWIGITVEQTMTGRRRATKDWEPKLRVIEFEAKVHARAHVSATASIEGLSMDESIGPDGKPLLALKIRKTKISPELELIKRETKVVDFIVPACTFMGLNICNIATPLIESQLTSSLNSQMHKIQASVGVILVKQMGDKGVAIQSWSGHAGCYLLRGCHGKSVDEVAKQGLILYYIMAIYNLILLVMSCCCCCVCCCCRGGATVDDDGGEDNSNLEVVISDKSLDISNLDSDLYLRGGTFETANASEK
mmetsp:Transcript_21198/g.59221  ORF Transcript_21198/g.59221 Transcript_21198/m.59221 type:complete len:514 (-) Transcript_21198:296-1837(-)|eukprot:CAMPEP_0177162420 /NCGR_PEP_ID=MMETSP0367-20130122/5875_1 /TAXON_ID=447022 ORGANISM="Scrippsiella hangoei-like, Strain SHHI-4" /NCGR_SAMPLE_ID=MMETSP0367 /ASSEMBLY_ACC=CAM_ASM_000362 /LENGTH=513 /DNA_ID=CAMNT_0018608189 /DNA_START=163 /DNA_END=1704 /DNA_ORIENTATION=+